MNGFVVFRLTVRVHGLVMLVVIWHFIHARRQ